MLCFISYLLKKVRSPKREDQGIYDDEELPDDLMESILQRLPLKPLLRFRAVCKRWDFKISSPAFSTRRMISCHLIYLDSTSAAKNHFSASDYDYLRTATIHDDNHGNLYYSTRRSLGDQKTSYIDKFDCIESLTRYDYLESPSRFHRISSGNGHISSCDGLVCISKSHKPMVAKQDTLSMKILNLATGNITQVAKQPDVLLDVKEIRMDKSLLGFGYDPIIDDYKIVFMFDSSLLGLGRCRWHVQVMSLKANTWRSVDYSLDLSFVRFCPQRFTYSVAVAGSVYWIVMYKSFLAKILKFSLTEEKFELLTFPWSEWSVPNAEQNEWVAKYSKLASHGGSLYLIVQTYRYTRSIDVWMLLPTANETSNWNEVVTIRIPGAPPACVDYPLSVSGTPSCIPLGFDCNGHVIMVVAGLLYAYVLEAKEFVRLDSSSHHHRSYLHLVAEGTLACPWFETHDHLQS